jgi:hypothetical protein
MKSIASERSITTIAEQARAGRAQFEAMAKGILESGGEFPRRLHVNTLGMRFMIDHYDTIISWTHWALESLRTWNDTTTAATTWAGPARKVLADAATPVGTRPPRIS